MQVDACYLLFLSKSKSLGSRAIQNIPLAKIITYIILVISEPSLNKVSTKLKSNIPTSPQFIAPIITKTRATLSRFPINSSFFIFLLFMFNKNLKNIHHNKKFNPYNLSERKYEQDMKKRFLFLLIFVCLIFTGCGKYSEDDIVKDFAKKVNKSKAYYVEGTMEIINNEDTYTYDVAVSYKEGDYYKVNLKNLLNDHEQIILRNASGVYVVTPSLNKSFKFQSEWPYNNSQIYLLKSIVEDVQKDETRTFEEKDGNYVFTHKVYYPNNKKLVKQMVILDKKLNVKEAKIMDESGNVWMKMQFDSIDLDASFKDDYFELSDNLESGITTEELKEVDKIEEVIYPMYLPVNTYLSGKEKMSTDSGERLILTFDGDSPFMLVEETAKKEEEHTIVPTYGDPVLLGDTIACINDNSVTWVSNGIEYYVISDVMSMQEIFEVAGSIGVLPVGK